MKVLEIEQGSQEWAEIRCTMPTASNFHKIYTGTGQKSKQWKQYALDLIIDRYAKGDADGFEGNEWTERGNILEKEARDFYEFTHDVSVDVPGFIYRDDNIAGGSPDGLIGDDGGLEIKCLKATHHIEMLLDGKMPTKYISQVQGCLWVTERKWWDFLGYHPKFRHLLVRVERDEAYINGLELAVFEFVSDMNKLEKEVLKVL